MWREGRETGEEEVAAGGEARANICALISQLSRAGLGVRMVLSHFYLRNP